MRVLVFTVCFPPIINGVSTRYLHFVRELRKQGHEVNVATPVPDAPDDYYGAKVWKVPGYRLPLNNFCHSEYVDVYDTYKIINAFKPDIIHCCTPTWIQLSLIFWSWWYSIPLVLSYHTHVPEYIKHYNLGWFGDVLAWMAWRIIIFSQNNSTLSIATSQTMADELRENGVTSEIQVWRRGVDTEAFHPSKADPEMRKKLMPGVPKELLMVYVGRISPEKSLTFLAPVMRDKRLRGRVHLAFVGEGPSKEQLIEKFGDLADCVTFHGFMTGDALASAYASADTFIFPSETETLGLVAIEAMANGLPVIGVRARGIKITVQDGVTGLLYDPDDTETCVKHVLRYLNNPEERIQMSKNARKDSEQWGWDKATSQVVGIYNDILSKHNSKEKQE